MNWFAKIVGPRKSTNNNTTKKTSFCLRHWSSRKPTTRRIPYAKHKGASLPNTKNECNFEENTLQHEKHTNSDKKHTDSDKTHNKDMPGKSFFGRATPNSDKTHKKDMAGKSFFAPPKKKTHLQKPHWTRTRKP